MPAVTLDEVQVDDNLSFTLYGPVNGSYTVAGQVIAHMSAAAVSPGSTAPSDHVNIWRDLPEEIKALYNNAWDAYRYLAVKTVDGVLYIGYPWIVEGSLVREDTGIADIRLKNFRDVDETALRMLLISEGYEIDSIVIG